jgi:hypothetical protein
MGHLPSRKAPVVSEPEAREDPGGASLSTLSEVLSRNEILHVNEDFVVVTPKQGSVGTAIQLADPTVQDLRQMGVTGGTLYKSMLAEDYNPELRGISAIRIYDKMKRNDADVRKSLRLLKTPVLAARWYMEPYQGGEGENGRKEAREFDKRVAERVWKNIRHDMTISWWQILNEALLMLDYGYYMFEKVFDFDKDGMVYLRKLAPIHPIDVLEWEYDDNGGPSRVKVATNIPSVNVRDHHPGWTWIPISKLAVFTFDREAGNMTGISVLRSAYKHWYYREQLFKIDAIQKERHGIGIPIIKLPPGFTDKDRSLANEMGSNLRTNERAHIVLPPNWDIEFVKIEGQPVNALDSARYHGSMITTNVLGEFADAEVTRASAVEAQWEIFQKAGVFIAETVKDTFNRHIIPELVDMNYRVTGYPELRARRVGDTTDWRTMSFAIRNFIGANALSVDDPLETWIRDEMDLPELDPDTVREVETPQAGGARVGPPRQAPPSTGGTGRSNAGADRSGG